jgi:hypothetical protein
MQLLNYQIAVYVIKFSISMHHNFIYPHPINSDNSDHRSISQVKDQSK